MLNSPLSQKKVAMISPFYNRRKVVERTIISMCSQSYSNLDIIVWDDASTDGTWDEMQRVAKKLNDPRLRIIKYDKNQGFTIGLNKAINMTDAEFVAIVGSGDVCHEKRVEAQVQALEENPEANFCATNSVTINVETNEKFVDDAFERKLIHKEDLLYKVPFTHGAVMFRKEAIIQCGLYEPVFKWCADWDLFLRLCDRNGYGIYLKEEYYYRYAMLDGASFNPEKSMEQLEYKYLARKLYESQLSRNEIIESASKDLRQCVSNYEKNIVRDLWKRHVKLIFMGEIESAQELERLINTKYGFSLCRKIGSFFAYIVRYFPISSNILINNTRLLAKIVKI